MQGSAIELAEQTNAACAESPPDLVLATDMTNLPAWLALARDALPEQTPIVLYMHENQLTYPWRPGEKPDLTYAMINWLSQLSADLVVFNSKFHRESWFAELPNLLKHFPDYNHLDLIDKVQSQARVLPVGIDPLTLDQRSVSTEAPLILWNQRWEYDKRPDRFFALLYQLEASGFDFRLAAAGENFRNQPAEFEEAEARLRHRIVQWGFLPSRQEYLALLQNADIVISTADHEFYGISILEAIQAGAFPLLPDRLSYPELIPEKLHAACLYSDDEDLYFKAQTRLNRPRAAPPSLRRAVVERYTWPVAARAYDDLFEQFSKR